ncbi:acid protease [Fomitiporia mediterranea MF3/22]|uniref:acid protease n=1 Tax=Fomitiporia mediterranea (strain MF3/22) TaxID=694068 RepID=UPI0004408D87|nr:acid protease [Fomitiporia mediterranea MF3/22]EJD05356.1 acid protease [Fomitiporia mediterranea MF3/22]
MLSRRAFLAVVSAVLFSSASVHGVSVSFNRVSSSSSEPGYSENFKIPSGSEKDQDGDNVFQYTNSNNVTGSDIYVASLSIDGSEFEVQLDTGSSDLWIDTTGLDLSRLTNTGVQTGLTYGDGTVAQGPVYVGPITFGNFTVNSAFISAPGTNATTNQDKGLLGVGPPQLSSITQALAKTPYESFSNTLLGSIFAANSSLPQFTTFSLSRSFATGKTDGGVFTVGEVPGNLSGILQAPKLNVVSSDRWIVLMDGITVNGRSVSGGSSFEAPGQTSSQTLVNLDTGTSLGQIPQEYAQVIYGSVPGSQIVRSSGVYILPCNTKLNVSFIFSGSEYPVHPIDTVAATTDDAGGVLCYSGFTFGTSGSEDFLLGDSFLRNVFSLYDYGRFFNESATPYVQLLSTTDKNQAYAEFDTLSQQRNQTLRSSQSSGGGSGSSGAVLSTGGVRLVSVVLAGAALVLGSIFVV